jgi:hypothetical protein
MTLPPLPEILRPAFTNTSPPTLPRPNACPADSAMAPPDENPLPTVMLIEPPWPALENPVWITTLPLAAMLFTPVFSKIEPEFPYDKALAVDTRTLPDPELSLSPEETKMLPPEAAAVRTRPPDRDTSPPAPLVLCPTTALMDPPRPPVDTPEPTNTQPELPDKEVPVANTTAPDTPADAASAVERTSSPDPLLTLEPLPM